MNDAMSDNIKIEKSISEQIIEKMIGNLKGSQSFTESILTELESIDLTNKSDVKETISKETEDNKNEDTEA
jgi:hypothetical protein